MKKIIENNKCLYFLKELLKYKKEIGILSISTIVSTVTVFLQPLLIKQITDIGILEKNMPQIVISEFVPIFHIIFLSHLQ